MTDDNLLRKKGISRLDKKVVILPILSLVVAIFCITSIWAYTGGYFDFDNLNLSEEKEISLAMLDGSKKVTTQLSKNPEKPFNFIDNIVLDIIAPKELIALNQRSQNNLKNNKKLLSGQQKVNSSKESAVISECENGKKYVDEFVGCMEMVANARDSNSNNIYWKDVRKIKLEKKSKENREKNLRLQEEAKQEELERKSRGLIIKKGYKFRTQLDNKVKCFTDKQPPITTTLLHDVFDSTGNFLILKKGSRFYGNCTTTSDRQHSQFVWREVDYQENRIKLENLFSSAADGSAGIRNNKESNLGKLVSGAILLSLIGTQTSEENNQFKKNLNKNIDSGLSRLVNEYLVNPNVPQIDSGTEIIITTNKDLFFNL